MEYTLTDIRDQVMTARGSHKRLRIAGGNTKAFYGNALDDDEARPCGALDMRAYRGVIDYQPSELVVTVRAGTPLAELEMLLAQENQMLAFEPPHFAKQGGDAAATVGGCIASGLAGPRRVAAGGVRDFVLGVRLLDSEGRVLRFGGEVMKNVAGYDVSRLMAGSLGIFGVLLDVSLKVVPKPLCERTLRLAADEGEALALFARWRAQPLPITASAWLPSEDGAALGHLWLRVSGSEPAVAAACAQIGGDSQDENAQNDADDFWASLREHTHPFFQTKPLWRLAVPPTTPPLGLGRTLIEWGGGQRWIADTSITAHQARQSASAAGGHATLFRRAGQGDDVPADGVFHPLAPGPAAITRNLKNEFDPTGLFNPGRLIPGL